MAESPKVPKAREELDDLEVSEEKSKHVRGGAVSAEQGDRLTGGTTVKGVQAPLSSGLL